MWPRLGWLLPGGAAVVLAVPLAALAATLGSTELVSRPADGGVPVTDRGVPAITPDGRFVVFHSAGRDLDAADTNPHEDVFIRDGDTGHYARVSLSSTGGDANGASTSGAHAVSADGNRIAFVSTAGNLVQSDNNLRPDVFVRDRAAGTTTLVSRNAAGLDANGAAAGATISDDGQRVAFTSDAGDMVAGDLNTADDVFVRDLGAGTTELVSATPTGIPGAGRSGPAVISADGSKVVFVSRAGDLVPGDTNGRSDIFVRDLAGGQTTRVSVATSGAQANGDSIEPFVSADGRYVGFSSLAGNLAGVKASSGTSYELYLRDTVLDRTERLSMLPSGLEQTTGSHRNGAISADGRIVTFGSTSREYALGDSANSDVFALDRSTDEIVRVSSGHDGRNANGTSDDSVPAATGVAFRSNATNLVPGMATAFNRQVFLRPLTPDTIAANADGDGTLNLDDVCPNDADPGQGDFDSDGRGDACDLDDDSDRVQDGFEPAQESDPFDSDSDDDGFSDLADDYPTDPARQLTTEHHTVNVADLEGGDGEVVAKLTYSATLRKFDTRSSGKLLPNTPYSLVVFRRHPGIRAQFVCGARTDASGAFTCSRSVPLGFFTHVELRKGTAAVATAECAQSALGERRCNVP